MVLGLFMLKKIVRFFFANNIKSDDMKKTILPSSVGTAKFTILGDVIVPNALTETSYENL